MQYPTFLRITSSLIAVLTFSLIASSVTADQSFRQAKKQLVKIHADRAQSFYCQCDYKAVSKKSGKGKKLQPIWQSCGYQYRKQQKRASRIEWEHIMPAHHFGQQLACWRQGGRKACKKDKVFRQMEGDMHNLVPAIGEVNGDRSNYKFAMIDGEKRVYGQCDAEVDFKTKRFEPAPHARGDIARAYFYMADKYQLRLSKQQKQLLQAWAKQDPISDWERERNKRINKIQGNLNPYISGKYLLATDE